MSDGENLAQRDAGRDRCRQHVKKGSGGGLAASYRRDGGAGIRVARRSDQNTALAHTVGAQAAEGVLERDTLGLVRAGCKYAHTSTAARS